MLNLPTPTTARFSNGSDNCYVIRYGDIGDVTNYVMRVNQETGDIKDAYTTVSTTGRVTFVGSNEESIY